MAIYSNSDFDYTLQVLSGSSVAGTYTVTAALDSTSSKTGLPVILTTRTPIVIGGNSSIETVVPTSVSKDNLGNYLITAVFASAHSTGDQITSGSFGVQEAAEAAAVAGGGLVQVQTSFYKHFATVAAGNAALVTYLSPATTVTLLDYSGTSGALSYAGAANAVYASTTHVIY